MANEPSDQPATLMHSVTRMLDSAVNDGAGYDTIIHVLSLLCLVFILNRTQPASAQAAVQATPAGGANALQKLIGDLAKGDGGLGPESLMTLLPLLNSPQIKSKLNPATIGTVLGLLNTMGDKSDKHEPAKPEKSEKTEKAEKVEKVEKAEKPPASDKTEPKPDPVRTVPPPTAATVTSMEALSERSDEESPPQELQDRKGLGRYLNWKTNF
ncbi:MAG TPA: hypothetical protein PKA10_10595 [Selenomonadales bacterium]|nr:hypothetical protein [Selenomonadales bacterium]